jgi:hypothetical protein
MQSAGLLLVFADRANQRRQVQVAAASAACRPCTTAMAAPALGVGEYVARPDALGMNVQQARHALQVVFDAVVDFAHQCVVVQALGAGAARLPASAR